MKNFSPVDAGGHLCGRNIIFCFIDFSLNFISSLDVVKFKLDDDDNDASISRKLTFLPFD